MRLLSALAAVSIATAGPGCTAIGAGTGALAASIANRFIDPDAPHRISVGATAAVGALMGFVIDIVIVGVVSQGIHDIEYE
ncbi:MAG TPA: hypothetical protein VLM79_05635 [Kofleriaceae bacterium]|nr:hypothetical protein [Kofleriaceae bacterium]